MSGFAALYPNLRTKFDHKEPPNLENRRWNSTRLVSNPMSAKPSRDNFNDLIPAGADVRFGTGRFRHATVGNQFIEDLKFSPCGRWLASGGRDCGSICLWDAHLGRLMHRWENEDQGMLDEIFFSPDSQWVIALPYGCPWREEVRAWEVQSGKAVTWPRLNDSRGIQFSPSGDRVVLSFKNHAEVFRFPDLVSCCTLIPPWPLRWSFVTTFVGEEYVCGSKGNDAWLWDRTGAITLAREFSNVNKVLGSPDGQRLVIVAMGKPMPLQSRREDQQPRGDQTLYVHIWQIASQQWLTYRYPTKDYGSGHIVFSADSQRIMLESRDHSQNHHKTSLYVLDAVRKAPPDIWKDAIRCYSKLVPASDAKHVAVVSESAEADFGASVRWLNIEQRVVDGELIAGGQSPVVAVSPDSRFIATACREGLIELFLVPNSNGPIPPSCELNSATGHQSEIRAMEFSADGSTLVTKSRELLFWDAKTGQRLADGIKITNLSVMTVSPNGQHVAICFTDDKARRSVIQTFAQGCAEPLSTIRLPKRGLTIAFQHDNGQLLVKEGSKQWIKRFDVTSGEIIDRRRVEGEIDGKPVPFAVTPSDGEIWRFCSTKRSELIFNATDTTPIFELPFPELIGDSDAWLNDVQFLPARERAIGTVNFFVGQKPNEKWMMACVSWDLKSQAIDAVTRLELSQEEQCDGNYPTLAIADNGDLLIAQLQRRASDDAIASLRVHHANSGQIILDLTCPDILETGGSCDAPLVCFPPDAKRIVCALDNRALMWSLD